MEVDRRTFLRNITSLAGGSAAGLNPFAFLKLSAPVSSVVSFETAAKELVKVVANIELYNDFSRAIGNVHQTPRRFQTYKLGSLASHEFSTCNAIRDLLDDRFTDLKTGEFLDPLRNYFLPIGQMDLVQDRDALSWKQQVATNIYVPSAKPELSPQDSEGNLDRLRKCLSVEGATPLTSAQISSWTRLTKNAQRVAEMIPDEAMCPLSMDITTGIRLLSIGQGKSALVELALSDLASIDFHLHGAHSLLKSPPSCMADSVVWEYLSKAFDPKGSAELLNDPAFMGRAEVYDLWRNLRSGMSVEKIEEVEASVERLAKLGVSPPEELTLDVEHCRSFLKELDSPKNNTCEKGEEGEGASEWLARAVRELRERFEDRFRGARYRVMAFLELEDQALVEEQLDIEVKKLPGELPSEYNW